LSSQEFGDRIIGSTMLGFLRGEDVWCIARLYDEEAIRLMEKDQLSTSPGVVFRPSDGNVVGKTNDGDTILIEGRPSVLSHLAICTQGVWDKSRAPSGVADGLLDKQLNTGAAAMADEDKEKAAADAAAKHDSDMRKMDEKFSAMD